MVGSSLPRVVSRAFSSDTSVSVVLCPFSSSVPGAGSFSVTGSLVLVGLRFGLRSGASLAIILPMRKMPIVGVTSLVVSGGGGGCFLEVVLGASSSSDA